MHTARMISIRWFIFLALLGALSPLQSAESWQLCACKGEALHRHFVEENSLRGKLRQFAPDRIVDLQHLKLEVAPDFDARTLEATATVSFAPIAKPVREMTLHAVDLDIQEVTSTHPLESWHVTESEIVFLFQNPLAAEEDATLTIEYSAEPRDGLFFRTPEMGYPEGDTHLWTQGEPEKHRHWFPSHDYPNERFTSEVICTVPEGMTVLSNGREVSSETTDGQTTAHWHQEQPHVNYLITLVAGYFEGLKTDLDGLPLGFYTPPSEFAQAANSFADTEAILRYFQEEIGVDYPWAKYYSVCVQGYPYGGMENTSMTTLTTRTLFTEATENIRTTRGLDAHEIAHQWFGDLVTCKDWTHLWLNEGFATYYTELYEGHKFGRDHMLYGMYGNAEGVLRQKDEKPIAWRNYERPWDQFDYRAYPKGAWVLHMLRSQIGEEVFREAIRVYLEAHEFDVVVTEDLNAALEDVTGRNWDRFFDQWVYHGGTPRLTAAYAWDAKRKQAKLSFTQTQNVSDQVLLFHLPIPIRFHLKDGETRDFQIELTEKSEDFYFELPSQPSVVRVDPDYTVLASIDLKAPNPLIDAQAQLEGDMMGRLLAVRMLGKRKDQKSRELLKVRLLEDEFFGVRIEAAKALANRGTRDDLDILLAATEQSDALVRQEVVRGISQFYEESARDALLAVAEGESNPEIVAIAVTGLAQFPEDAVQEAIVNALDQESYRHRIGAAAMEGLRKLGDPTQSSTFMTHLSENAEKMDDRSLGRSLDHLAFLARELEDAEREEARLFLADYLQDLRSAVRVSAIRALQTLGDPRSLTVLESLRGGESRETPESEAAEKAIAALNAGKPQSGEVSDLRKEVLELQKQIRSLQSSFETMQEQAEPEDEE